MQKIVNNIRRSGWRTKCAISAFVAVNCFAVSVWMLNPDMWAASSEYGGWQVAVAELILGTEACLLLLAVGLTSVFIGINSD